MTVKGGSLGGRAGCPGGEGHGPTGSSGSPGPARSPPLPRVELAESTCLQPLVVLVHVLPIWEDLPALRRAPLEAALSVDPLFLQELGPPGAEHLQTGQIRVSVFLLCSDLWDAQGEGHTGPSVSPKCAPVEPRS